MTLRRPLGHLALFLIGGLLVSSNILAEDTPVAAESMKPYTESIEQTEVTIDFVPIPGGTFKMGSPSDELGRDTDEGPQHTVSIEPFWMGRYEVTWDQYEVWGENIDIQRRQIFGLNPSDLDKVADAVTRPTPPYTDMSFGMGKRKNPAICMTQHAARKYCEWLSAKTGHYYRLPTEAEWEYACRAGTDTAYSFGDDPAALDEHAWYSGNSDGSYHEVGQKKPNPWGLYDMHGNVSEWVLDQYVAKAYRDRKGPVSNPLVLPLTLYPRVVRGGGWDDQPIRLRSAARISSSEEWKQQDPQIPQSIWYHTDAHSVGFRLVRPLRVPSADERGKKWDRTEPPQLDPVVE
jgi:formylglycine-generating enzyme required for sulfatase activity